MISNINTPLGFFVLALLIVEAFLAAVLIGTELESWQRMTCILVGVILFVLVNIAVFSLVWLKPENLIFDKEAHLIDRGKVYGTESFILPDADSLPSDRATPESINRSSEKERN